MSNTPHPISIQTMFGWWKVERICVKWRNCLKREGRGRRSPTKNCSLVKYIMLFGRSIEDRASPHVSWIGMVFEIRKLARNYCLDMTLTRQSGLRHLTLVFFYPSSWGLLLVELTLPLSIRLSGFGPYGNLRSSKQLSEPITRPIRNSTLPH